MIAAYTLRNGRAGLCVTMALAALALLTGCQVPNQALRAQAWEALQKRDYAQADAKLRLAVVQNPADWRARILMGRLRLAQAQPLEAQLHLEHALIQRPDGDETPAILDLLAEAYFQQGENAKLAAFLADTASRRHGVEDYLRQAKYLARIGDSDGVNLAFLRAAKMARTDDIAPYLAAADYYQSIGDHTRAATNLRHAYYIAPDNAGVVQRLRDLGLVPGPTVGLPPLGGIP